LLGRRWHYGAAIASQSRKADGFGGGGERRRLLAGRGSDRHCWIVSFRGAWVPARLLSCHVPGLAFVHELVGRMDAVRLCPLPQSTACHQPTPLPAAGWVQGVSRASAGYRANLECPGGWLRKEMGGRRDPRRSSTRQHSPMMGSCRVVDVPPPPISQICCIRGCRGIRVGRGAEAAPHLAAS